MGGVQVFIEVLVEPPPEPGAGPMLRIVVDDDGRGLSAAERAQVSRRGQRLDESKPGSGLGLSIVVDLAALYGGSLSLGSAPIGGCGRNWSCRAFELAAGICPVVIVPKRLLNAGAFNITAGRSCCPHQQACLPGS